MDIKYQIKGKPDKVETMEPGLWDDFASVYLEKVNFDNYPLVNWDEIKKNAGHILVKNQENIFCVKQDHPKNIPEPLPTGSLFVRHIFDPLNRFSKTIVYKVDFYIAEPIK